MPHARQGGSPRRFRRGQAMIETVVVVFALSLAFLALAQYADLFRAKLVLTHAAARAARARAVGFNSYMTEKTMRVAAIPVSGNCLNPGLANGTLSTSEELARIPDYLASENDSFAPGILDYELWDRTKLSLSDADVITARIRQKRPLKNGFASTFRAFSWNWTGPSDVTDAESVDLGAGPKIEFKNENHYSLYMNNENL